MLTKIQEKQIRQLAKKINLKYLYLFGSRARGQIKPASDFDFAVKFDSEIIKNTFRAKLKLMSELSIILKRDDVDVVDLEQADPILAFNIIKDGQIIYSANERERIMDRVKIMQIYYDRQYYYNRHFKLAIGQMAHGRL
ncbi:MAG: nucleotidyltransferase domain-containing protein [bacterium]|nr:nucleotidyltransferase domain-containing protein [bacterium]